MSASVALVARACGACLEPSCACRTILDNVMFIKMFSQQCSVIMNARAIERNPSKDRIRWFSPNEFVLIQKIRNEFVLWRRTVPPRRDCASRDPPAGVQGGVASLLAPREVPELGFEPFQSLPRCIQCFLLKIFSQYFFEVFLQNCINNMFLLTISRLSNAARLLKEPKTLVMAVSCSLVSVAVYDIVFLAYRGREIYSKNLPHQYSKWMYISTYYEDSHTQCKNIYKRNNAPGSTRGSFLACSGRESSLALSTRGTFVPTVPWLLMSFWIFALLQEDTVTNSEATPQNKSLSYLYNTVSWQNT